jgi:prepilin-type N-terminal cleavage/methylation domain-containing protein
VHFGFRTPQYAIRTQRAFTLIELLTVIAIIAILAALIVGGAGIATVKARISRVKGERAALVTAIEQYKTKKGFYPPDNTNSTYINPLFYELTGTTIDPKGNYHAVTGEIFMPSGPQSVQAVFGIGGFLNSSSDPTEPPINFLKVSPNSRTVAIAFITPGQPPTFTLLGVPVPPGLPVALGGSTGQLLTPWNYVSSNPTNNPTEFDLWMDVTWRGTTNRISNWSEDPVPQ